MAHVGGGALCTTLDRLERKGFVQSAMSAATAERGARSRRLFALRPSGAVALKHAHVPSAQVAGPLSPTLTRTSS
jgi:DNA-binding PadR family transcriptional regulator